MNTIRITLLTLLVVLLAACGGGGSDNTGDNGNTAAPEHPTENFCPCFPPVPAADPASAPPVTQVTQAPRS